MHIHPHKLLLIASLGVCLFSCKGKSEAGKFSVDGEIKNAPDQQVYLEELYFSQKDPVVIDTGNIKNGKFTVTGLAPEEGLYRLRFEKTDVPVILINDKSEISLSADYKTLSPVAVSVNSPASASLVKFLSGLDAEKSKIESSALVLQQYPKEKGKDSAYQVLEADYNKQQDNYKHYVVNYMDTATDVMVALFTLGYTQNFEPELLDKPVANLGKRFPKNETVSTIIAQYNQMVAKYKSQPKEGSMAPDINMPDTSGKPFALSSLRGKYVLVDFWASWCGPCREENPNVVKAYNTFKDKNFAILGVSLDQDKAAWLKAIADDKLTWYQVSDLKYWNSAAAGLYGFDGIPYNVLVDPTGKIIASNLRGQLLENKLTELLK